MKRGEWSERIEVKRERDIERGDNGYRNSSNTLGNK